MYASYGAFESEKSPDARRRQRQREESLLSLDFPHRPSLLLHREHYRVSVVENASYRTYAEKTAREVAALEEWTSQRSAKERASPMSIRAALQFLKAWGRFAQTAPLTETPHRTEMVQWLALEHRWCYAAAGTDRATFDRATGRTGAR